MNSSKQIIRISFALLLMLFSIAVRGEALTLTSDKQMTFALCQSNESSSEPVALLDDKNGIELICYDDHSDDQHQTFLNNRCNRCFSQLQQNTYLETNQKILFSRHFFFSSDTSPPII